jgi:hypothetical protein
MEFMPLNFVYRCYNEFGWQQVVVDFIINASFSFDRELVTISRMEESEISLGHSLLYSRMIFMPFGYC